MPSGITHILLVKHLQERLPASKLKHTLAASRDFLQVGAVAPDLPYASIADDDFFLTTQSELADKFHYERTNEVPLLAFERIRTLKGGLEPPNLRSYFAFFIGYVSHIVADGLIHPFIRDKVGDYKQNQTAHRRLEMQLDVLFYRYLNFKSGAPAEFNNSNIHDELKNIQSYSILPQVMDLFSQTIRDVYGLSYDANTIHGWVTGLHRMFGIAEGNHPAIYRNIGLIDSFLFQDYDDLKARADDLLTLRKPIDRDVNFLKKPSVHFFDDILPRFYGRFIPIAQKGYDYIYNDGPLFSADDIPPIDLDTGRLLANNNLDEVPGLWA